MQQWQQYELSQSTREKINRSITIIPPPSLNPEVVGLPIKEPIGHVNPLTPKKKPFLTQVKQRAIHPDKYRTNQAATNEETTEKIVKISEYQIQGGKNQSRGQYIPVAQKLKTDLEAGSRTSSREKYMTVISAPGNQQELNRFLKDQNKFLRQKSQKINEDLKKQLEKTFLKDKQIREKHKLIEDLKNNLNVMRQIQGKYQRLHTQYNNLLRSTENNSSNHLLSQKYNQLFQHCSHLEGILQQKDQYLQNVIQQKANEFNSQLSFKNSQIKALEMRVQILEKQNNALCQDKNQLVRRSSCISEQIDVNRFEVIIRELQESINQKIKEISILKNTIGQQQGKIEELITQNNSLSTFVKALEQREEMSKDSKIVSEIQLLRQELENEKQMHDSEMSRKDLEILKLENEIQTKKYEKTGSLLDFTEKQKLFQNFSSLLKELEELRAQRK